MAILMDRRTAGVFLSATAYVFSSGCQAFLTDASISNDDETAALCDAYCETVSETCDGDNLQYGSSRQCLAACRTMDEGEAEDESGNTISCRLHYALEAAEAPNDHCRSAGPGGAGVCGSDCESFCQIHDEVCVDDNRQYDTITECMGACAVFDDTIPFNAGVLDGDSFACRLTHLTLATISPDVHCPHIAPVSEVCF